MKKLICFLFGHDITYVEGSDRFGWPVRRCKRCHDIVGMPEFRNAPPPPIRKNKVLPPPPTRPIRLSNTKQLFQSNTKNKKRR